MGQNDDHKPPPKSHQPPHKAAPSTVGGREPSPAALAAELPETYGVDEIEILCKDPWWYFAYWEVTSTGFAAAQEQLGPADSEPKLVLRVFTTAPPAAPPASGGGRSRDGREIRDVPVQARHGRRYLEIPRATALLRVAIGLLSPEGLFAPIAQSSLVRVPPQQPSSETAVEWLHVLPSRSGGREHERIVAAPPAPSYRERALPWRTDGSSRSSEDSLHLPGPQSSSRPLSSWSRGPGESDGGGAR